MNAQVYKLKQSLNNQSQITGLYMTKGIYTYIYKQTLFSYHVLYYESFGRQQFILSGLKCPLCLLTRGFIQEINI